MSLLGAARGCGTQAQEREMLNVVTLSAGRNARVAPTPHYLIAYAKAQRRCYGGTPP